MLTGVPGWGSRRAAVYAAALALKSAGFRPPRRSTGLNLALYLEPIPPPVAATRLRGQRARGGSRWRVIAAEAEIVLCRLARSRWPGQ